MLGNHDEHYPILRHKIPNMGFCGYGNLSWRQEDDNDNGGDDGGGDDEDDRSDDAGAGERVGEAEGGEKKSFAGKITE